MGESGGATTTAIIVNWRSAAETVRLIDSLLPCVAKGLRFVVLENGSGDAATLREAFADARFAHCVTFLECETNLGFCGGVNVAVDAALAAGRPDYLWLLNPDMHPGAETLCELVAVARESGAAVVSARAGGSERFAGENWPLSYFAPRFMGLTKPRPDARWWLTDRYHGGCALFERRLVERLREGGDFLHEPLFMYWDEWETSRRAAPLGARFAVAARASVHHNSGAQARVIPGLAEARIYYIVRNGILFGRMAFRPWQQPFVIPMRIARDGFYYLLRERGAPRVFFEAVRDGLRGKTGEWKRHPGHT